jgi:transcriptional regulator with PAS, ATPase and Fis domain
MNIPDYFNEIGCAITVCDLNGIVVYMNEKAGQVFAKYGGKELVGKSLMNCHSEKSVLKIRELMQTAGSNSYTIEKGGKKKIIHQTPWFVENRIAGLVEFSIELPAEMPHFVRS